MDTRMPTDDSKPVGPYEPICNFGSWTTVTVDQNLFEELMNRINAVSEARAKGKTRWAQDRILRASAYETGAVEDLYAEGATYSVAMEIDGWKGGLADSGDGAEQHFDDQLAAYVLARDWSDQPEGRPITEVDVRELHSVATRSQKTYPVHTSNGVQHHAFQAGVYKINTNHAINRAGVMTQYAPVEDVPPEMAHLIMTIRTDDFQQAHPVVQSAYIHWAIAHIHPFADGNGRMARVMGSLPLLQHYGIPLVVFAGRKRRYLQALESADNHDHQEMVNYVSARTSETLSWLAELLEGVTAQEAADESLASISRLLEAQAGKLETRKEAAERVLMELKDAVEQECSIRFADTPIAFGLTSGSSSYNSALHSFFYGSPYEVIGSDLVTQLSIEAVPGHYTSSTTEVGYAQEAIEHPVVAVHDLGSDRIYFSLEDCSPDLSASAQLRLRNLASSLVSRLTKKLETELVGIFRQHGQLPTQHP